jgi:hypothetical protein
METVISAVQKYTVLALAAMLIVVMVLSTVHLGELIGEEILKPPKWLIPVQGLLEIFGYFLLVLIGVELLETLKAYVKKDVIRVRVVARSRADRHGPKGDHRRTEHRAGCNPVWDCGADSISRHRILLRAAGKRETGHGIL